MWHFRSFKNKTYIFPVALLIDTKRGALSIDSSKDLTGRFRCPCGLRRRFTAARLHGCSSLVFVVCCVGIGLCEELIPRSEESYCVCLCVCVCDSEISKRGGLSRIWAVVPQQRKWPCTNPITLLHAISQPQIFVFSEHIHVSKIFLQQNDSKNWS
jgi:hypothetical protein